MNARPSFFYTVISAIACLVQTTANASPLLEQKLEELYQQVAQNFEENPWFKNDSNPELFSQGYQTRRMTPEFQMPPLDLFKSQMKSYCVLMESPDAKRISRPTRYSVVDYTEDATYRRLYVYDTKAKAFIHNTWTTHGSNSITKVQLSLKDSPFSAGRANPIVNFVDELNGTFYSNEAESNQSTIGMTISDPKTYWSTTFECNALRMNGVDGALNSKILSRAIVVHAFDYRASDIRYYDHIPASWGCVMLQRQGFYQGTADAPIADIIIKDMTGGPILLYHDRMKPEVNEKMYRDQIATYTELQLSSDRNVAGWGAEYGWSEDQIQKVQKDLSAKLKTSYLDQVEKAYRYFKNPSKFVGKEPKSETACLKALNLN